MQKTITKKMRTAHNILVVAVMTFVTIAANPLQAQNAAEYDVVIRNGRVLDGAGNPWILADVAIHQGRFVRIGRVTGRGAREIDARGRYVSPGWIDMMDQSGRYCGAADWPKTNCCRV